MSDESKLKEIYCYIQRGNQTKISSPPKTKLALTIKTISNKRGIAREIVQALGTSARCIRMAFIHFKGMDLATFVNVQYTVKNC